MWHTQGSTILLFSLVSPPYARSASESRYSATTSTRYSSLSRALSKVPLHMTRRPNFDSSHFTSAKNCLIATMKSWASTRVSRSILAFNSGESGTSDWYIFLPCIRCSSREGGGLPSALHRHVSSKNVVDRDPGASSLPTRRHRDSWKKLVLPTQSNAKYDSVAAAKLGSKIPLPVLLSTLRGFLLSLVKARASARVGGGDVC